MRRAHPHIPTQPTSSSEVHGHLFCSAGPRPLHGISIAAGFRPPKSGRIQARPDPSVNLASACVLAMQGAHGSTISFDAPLLGPITEK